MGCGTLDELVLDRFCLDSITKVELRCGDASCTHASDGGYVWKGLRDEGGVRKGVQGAWVVGVL